MNPVLIAGLAMQGAGYLNGALNKAKMRPTIKYNDAAQRAGVLLNPQYNTQMQQALTSVNNDLINRGFFGQAEGASLASQTAGQVEGAKQKAITEYAQGLMDADYQKALDQYNMEQAGKDRITNGLMGIGGMLSGIGGTIDERQYNEKQAQAQREFESQAADTAYKRALEQLGIQHGYSQDDITLEDVLANARQDKANNFELGRMERQAGLDRDTNAAQELLRQQTYKANAQTDIDLLPIKQKLELQDFAKRQGITTAEAIKQLTCHNLVTSFLSI
jgi:hypothetical protein